MAVSVLAVGVLVASTAASADVIRLPRLCFGGPVTGVAYSGLVVVGDCFVPSGGTLTVSGSGLWVAAGASFNGISDNSSVTVWGGVHVRPGGAFGLGCSPNVFCVSTTSDHVHGGLFASAPSEVNLHSDTVDGGIFVTGGGSGMTCLIPSRLVASFPEYSDFEDNTVSGPLTVSGMHSCYIGTLRNSVSGTVTIEHNRFADPDANQVSFNTIGGNLVCLDNIQPAFGGPNTVAGLKIGECAGL
jgi:hypothetical protein